MTQSGTLAIGDGELVRDLQDDHVRADIPHHIRLGEPEEVPLDEIGHILSPSIAHLTMTKCRLSRPFGAQSANR